MKMSITHGDVKASIFRADGEELAIRDILDQFVTPLLITAGFMPETVERALGSVAPKQDGIFIRLPDLPEGFVSLGVIGHNDNTADRENFPIEDILYMSGFEWVRSVSFRGQYPYAVRAGSAAHAHALKHYPQA